MLLLKDVIILQLHKYQCRVDDPSFKKLYFYSVQLKVLSWLTQCLNLIIFPRGIEPKSFKYIVIYNPFFFFKVMRDPETGNSKAFAFINFASFEASDAAIEAMNNQYLCNRPISVSYAFKKDVKGERHGSAAERYVKYINTFTI